MKRFVMHKTGKLNASGIQLKMWGFDLNTTDKKNSFLSTKTVSSPLLTNSGLRVNLCLASTIS